MKVITTDNAAATQTEHPWRSALRTVLQVALLAYPVFLTLPEILTIIDDSLGEYLPDEARTKLLLVATVITAGAGAIARIMVIPAIEKALRTIGAGAAPTELTFGNWAGADSDLVIPIEEPAADDVDDGDDAEPEGTADDEHDLAALAAIEVDNTPPPEDYRPRH
ncbi:hypothetical protein AAFP32_11960 [Brevibacterium sp. CBA3109]|uniref:Uncharacterized protein n=1 Tax=Brevibacterium koreense TaxID=3140787 RepID=A0AAU7UJ12_9MICO